MSAGARQAKPWVTLLLLLAGIGVAYWLLLHPRAVFDFGFDARKPAIGAAFSSLFLHSNVLHLLGNMLFLAAVGPAVEQAAGWWRFAIVSFAGGLLGVLAHWVFAAKDGPMVPLIGASGCVAACIAYYNVRFVRLHVALAPKVGASVLVVTIAWLILQVLGLFWHVEGDAGGTALWAHLGGFVAGILLSLLFKAPEQAERQLGQSVVATMEKRSPAAKLAASDLHLASHPNDIQVLFKKADSLATLGEHDEEAKLLIKMLGQLPEQDQPPVLARLIGIGRIALLTSLQRTIHAERLKAANPALSKSLLLSVVGGSKADSERADALLALASLSEPGEAKMLLSELMKEFPLHPATELARARGLL